MRRAIAAAVSRSKREIPHYYLATDVDFGPAATWLLARNAAVSPAERVLPSVLVLKAVALSLEQYPRLNGFWRDDAFHPGDGVHLGVAIALRGGGLMAPAVHDANRRSLAELMALVRDLVQRARTGGLRGSEMTDATSTVTSLGDQGVTSVFGIIYPPQVAIVGFGKITERPWAEQGMLAVRPVLTATLAADHRVTDGHYGGLFLADVARRLRAPESL
jgi:pyruvate dehydrogenase E2 component (dihydrolipoamide acetyltransferase)